MTNMSTTEWVVLVVAFMSVVGTAAVVLAQGDYATPPDTVYEITLDDRVFYCDDYGLGEGWWMLPEPDSLVFVECERYLRLDDYYYRYEGEWTESSVDGGFVSYKGVRYLHYTHDRGPGVVLCDGSNGGFYCLDDVEDVRIRRR